jgi:hypothetical protein
MITALLTFLGSATLRLVFGHIFDAFTKWQDNRNELARMKVQGELEAAQHARNLEAIRVQAELGVKVIEAQTQAHVSEAEADAFLEAVKATGQKTGIVWVDMWNGIIRPLLATIAIGLWITALTQRGFALDDWDRALMSCVLGIFIGGRIHATGR